MAKGGWVYIIINRPHGVLYTGVAASLARRVAQHRAGEESAFAAQYNVQRLVYAERHDDIAVAIWREKAIKAWKRDWKVRLIEGDNPEWRDLWDEMV